MESIKIISIYRGWLQLKGGNKMNNTMTIFYSKFTGNIEGVFSGEVGFDVFVDREEDVKSYCIRKVAEYNGEFLAFFYNYKVNLETNTIELKKLIKEINFKIVK